MTIEADPHRLRQLFENLIRNAVEHGGEDVTITAGRLDGGFFAADDGSGFTEEEREHMFEIGYSTSESGTVLGLTIVEEVATAHGWELCVTRSDAGGACFEFRNVSTR